MTRRVIIISICIFFQIQISAAQDVGIDTIGYIDCGRIRFNKNFKYNKIFDSKTYLYQEQYLSGKISKEWVRNDDSTFLFTEYYENIDTVFQNTGGMGIKREGFVFASNVESGDTIIQFDPDTYEESIRIGTLLLPIKKWAFYYPNGRLMEVGEYKQYKRDGIWKFYDRYQNLNHTIEYKEGRTERVDYVNKIEEESSKKTKNGLLGSWIIPAPEVNRPTDPKLEGFKFMFKLNDPNRIGEIYTFEGNKKVQYSKSIIIKTEPIEVENGLIFSRETEKIKDTEGTWRLSDFQQIEIQIDKVIETYQIKYLSDSKLILKKRDK